MKATTAASESRTKLFAIILVDILDEVSGLFCSTSHSVVAMA